MHRVQPLSLGIRTILVGLLTFLVAGPGGATEEPLRIKILRGDRATLREVQGWVDVDHRRAPDAIYAYASPAARAHLHAVGIPFEEAPDTCGSGLMIHNAIKEGGVSETFFGHLSPTDFLLVIEPATSGPIAERVRARLEQSLDYFYPIKDRDSGLAQKNRLVVQTANLASGELKFRSMDEIKAELARRKK